MIRIQSRRKTPEQRATTRRRFSLDFLVFDVIRQSFSKTKEREIENKEGRKEGKNITSNPAHLQVDDGHDDDDGHRCHTCSRKASTYLLLSPPSVYPMCVCICLFLSFFLSVSFIQDTNLTLPTGVSVCALCVERRRKKEKERKEK